MTASFCLLLFYHFWGKNLEMNSDLFIKFYLIVTVLTPADRQEAAL